MDQPSEMARLEESLDVAAHVAERLGHDFGNVLTGILGFTELALKQVPPDSLAHGYMREVLQSSMSAAAWVHKLQLFSRRAAQKSSATNTATTLAMVLAEEGARITGAWGGRVALQVKVEEGLPPIPMEADALREALAQALANAFENCAGASRGAAGIAGSMAGGVVHVAAQSCELSDTKVANLLGAAQPGRFVETAIRDDGPRMPEDVRGKLFRELFFSSKGRRRGMGLAVIYGILRTYGGAMRFDAGGERGNTLRLYMPAAIAPASNAAAPTTASANARTEKRILVVDDDPVVLASVSETLESAGYDVRRAESGDVALRDEGIRRKGNANDASQLVVTDVLMPRMNGFEMARRFLERDPAVAFLFISSQADTEALAGAELLERFPLLRKPFEARSLLRAVDAAMVGREMAGRGTTGCGRQP
ncbi:MAG: response regulator [Planctomycetes bacterium]|nr:response regulator [Planctomycetota bacterium]